MKYNQNIAFKITKRTKMQYNKNIEFKRTKIKYKENVVLKTTKMKHCVQNNKNSKDQF